MKQQILTLILSLASLTGLRAQETYYEKHVAFPANATAEEKLDMASRLVPTPQQLEWQQMELTAFLHFGVNTFTGREWGDGTEDPNIFNPHGPGLRTMGAYPQGCRFQDGSHHRQASRRLLPLAYKDHPPLRSFFLLEKRKRRCRSRTT